MVDSKFNLSIPLTTDEILNIPLKEGSVLFVLGANGVGKSALMHYTHTYNYQDSKRILAHRQTWFSSNTAGITASDKQKRDEDIKQNDNGKESRWMDGYAYYRALISIFELINSENIRARKIAMAYDNQDLELAKKHSMAISPLQVINDILKISNIPIEISLGSDDAIFASKNGGELYSIAELSDGEKNALLIASDVLTAKSNSLIIIDEPERHLHRSIISPLLTTLIQKREDCAFVISTHDVELPNDHSNASILLVRGCDWQEIIITKWDADLINSDSEIPQNIKQEILGAKRELLFVEGNSTSLDMQIYQLIYPNVSVLPQGNCGQVERAVDGIKGTESIHWINAYGLVDADDRTQEQIDKLLGKGIAALPVYSVEALYYHLYIIEKVAFKISEATGEDANALYLKAIGSIVADISQHKERICARLCEKKLRNDVMYLLPKHTDIQQRDTFNLNFDLDSRLQGEEDFFDILVANDDILSLIARYPIRETQVLSNVVSKLGVTKDRYESIVRKLIIDVPEVREFYKVLLQPLTNLIQY